MNIRIHANPASDDPTQAAPPSRVEALACLAAALRMERHSSTVARYLRLLDDPELSAAWAAAQDAIAQVETLVQKRKEEMHR